MAVQLLINAVDKSDNIAKNSLRIVNQSDNRQSLNITLNCKANDYIPLIGQDIVIKKTAAGTVLFGGCIKEIRKQKQEPMQGSDSYIEVDVSSDGYNHIPARRTISQNYTSNETGNIVSAMRTIMSGEVIGLGNITAGITIDNEYYSIECQSIKEVLDNLAEISGCKWYIDSTKALNFVSEDTVTTAAHTIAEGGAFTDFHNLVCVEQLDNYCNKVFVTGNIDSDGNLLYVTASNTSDITARAAIEGTANSTGVYGIVLSDANIDTLTAASTVADNYLKKYSIDPQEISFGSYQTDWAAGTQISIDLPVFGMTAAITALIEEVTITQEETNLLKSTVKCTRRNSANFSTQKSQGGVEYFEQLIKQYTKAGSTNKVTDGSGNNYYVVIYVQDDEPTDAKAHAVWIDTNDFSRYDVTALTTATLNVSSVETIFLSGTATLTLHAGTAAGIIKNCYNVGTAICTLAGTINGATNMKLYPGEGEILQTDGTNWRH